MKRPSKPQQLHVVRAISELRRVIRPWRTAGEKTALVPTMGALHGGHFALVRSARRRAQRVVVSIFVNPAQFAPHEDLASYPRRFGSDVAALKDMAVDLVWAPPADVMYPPNFATRIVPAGPATVGLEDKFRPHFFAGVATVVGKLLIQCMPDYAMFGEKDYQQLKVVRRLARDLDLPVTIIAVPTVREKDGLALSSRNAYLSAGERNVAPILHRVLEESAEKIAAGALLARVLDEGGATIESAGFALDYFEARHAETLQPIGSVEDGPVRLLVAARLGKTRLIDNAAVPLPGRFKSRTGRGSRRRS
jgi:pantoate--beta-alanine ligase